MICIFHDPWTKLRPLFGLYSCYDTMWCRNTVCVGVTSNCTLYGLIHSCVYTCKSVKDFIVHVRTCNSLPHLPHLCLIHVQCILLVLSNHATFQTLVQSYFDGVGTLSLPTGVVYTVHVHVMYIISYIHSYTPPDWTKETKTNLGLFLGGSPRFLQQNWRWVSICTVHSSVHTTSAKSSLMCFCAQARRFTLLFSWINWQ